MATIDTLNYISRQLNIYLGLFMFIFGLIGSCWNILIFRHYSLRLSSYCTYILILSIASLIQLLFNLSDRIIDQGFGIHWTIYNIAWCKLRYYIAQCTSLIALSCLVYSSIDRFFSTCHQIKWRRLNSVYIAKQICLFTILFWMIITIPTLIYIKPIQLTTDHCVCQSSSLIWSKIIIYFFNLCCYGIFPWVFMSLFGFLTWKNTRQIRNHRVGVISTMNLTRMARFDDQLASMLFLQIIICIISSIPFCIQNIYYCLTQTISTNLYRQAQENLFFQIAYLIFYFNYISTFYSNYLSSNIFRHVSKEVLMNLCKKREDVSREITMINHQENNHKQLDKRRYNIFTI
ncbi:unnamed protein product [Adineta steineri]|uniref:G-protein coupled receptors family 1 profile domain-containing protein n=1 Tax=Adineta steineri TaxID=433720 RepID=A0A813RLT8_9BILA|nr:unnamed protein product [Adineta steineri]